MDKKFVDLKCFKDHHHFLAGVDEVGRGPLAGPVVAASVMLVKDESYKIDDTLKELKKYGVFDSKKLSSEARIKIIRNVFSEDLKENQIFKYKNIVASIASADHHEIDELNILNASLLAMKRSFENIKEKKTGLILIDGKFVFKTKEIFETNALVKGDQKSVLIAMASIIAKEYRDNLMKDLDHRYPGYGLARHAGYPTKFHLEALEKLGPSIIHRKSFGPVKKFYAGK